MSPPPKFPWPVHCARTRGLFIIKFLTKHMPSFTSIRTLVAQNWQAGLTVALISVPLSIALSIASGAGPLPGLVTGVVATLIAGFFGGSHFNIIGAAGALATVLFAATLAAPAGLGAAVLPFIAITTGLIILLVWFFEFDRYLYYIPSSVMYGFAAGVAILIAASQLFDASGLSALSRTGHLTGDLEKFVEHWGDVHLPSLAVFSAFLVGILVFKRFVKRVPAVIPAAVIGILVGYFADSALGLTTLADKFGDFEATLILPVSWAALDIFRESAALMWILKVSGIVALIAILETLITAKLGDKLTRTESSSSRELLGLALANIGSGAAGGLPATGVFIRTGANIKAGATHRTSGILTALFSALIALLVLPFFSYLPMPVIAAVLTNTALGLLELHKFKEFYQREMESFGIAILVALITIFHDAGLGVTIGAVTALVLFARKIARGRFDVVWNYSDGTKEDVRSERHILLPKNDKSVRAATYSIAGNLGYIDAERHRLNFKRLAEASNIDNIIIRLRDLFSIDIEGVDALSESVSELQRRGKGVYFASVSPTILDELLVIPAFAELSKTHHFNRKTSDILKELGVANDH